jgi:hypothetical protein
VGRRTGFAVSFVSTVLSITVVAGPFLLILLIAGPAAATSGCLQNPQAQVEAAAENNAGNGFMTGAIGNRESVWINPSANDYCLRVSSIAIGDTLSGAFAEAGVEESTHADQYCDQTDHQAPELFVAWETHAEQHSSL